MVKSPDAFRTISEVADWLGIQAHVLRFWESKFTQVKPIKRAGGRRYYRPADMLLLGGIKKLLHDDGLTIKGVQKILREEGMTHVSSLSAPLDELDFVEPRPAPKPDIIRPETGVVLSFGGAKADAAPEAAVSKENAEAPSSAAPVEETAGTSNAAPVTAQRPSPVPPADDHPRATPDPLAPSDSETPDAPQVTEPDVEAETPALAEPTPASSASLPDFLKRPLVSEAEMAEEPADAMPQDVEAGPQEAEIEAQEAEVEPKDAEAAPQDAEIGPEEAEVAPPEAQVEDGLMPAIIDLPDFTPEADFPASPGLLSVGARVHRLPRQVQPRVAGLLLDLAELRARMAAELGHETNY